MIAPQIQQINNTQLKSNDTQIIYNKQFFAPFNLLKIVFFYFTCRKNVIRDRSTEDDVHLVHRELDVGKQTNKSVQVEHIIGYS